MGAGAGAGVAGTGGGAAGAGLGAAVVEVRKGEAEKGDEAGEEDEVDDEDEEDLQSWLRRQVQKAEETVLARLSFRICAPTAHTFLARFLAAAQIEETTSVGFLATLFAELCLASYPMLSHKPSEVAAAVLFLAMRLYLGADAWAGSEMSRFVKLSEASVLEVARAALACAILPALALGQPALLQQQALVADYERRLASLRAAGGASAAGAVCASGPPRPRYGVFLYYLEKYRQPCRGSVSLDLTPERLQVLEALRAGRAS